MAAVDCEHIDKVFPDGTQALRDCTLRVEDGELVVLVGPSGCGKSTLLRIVAGLETATRGTLRIGGRVANALTPQQRNVAMVFQDYALYPHMTVRRNLEYPLRMRRMRRDEISRRVEWAARLLDISAVLERKPAELSGGQRQRVAMGRALVREPAVFLLDEPLSNLDAKLRTDVRAEIAALQQRTQTTMIYVTHDQTEAMTLGHRVCVLNHGVIEQVAPPRELYDRPATAFVARFIGNPPMNVFETAWEPAGDARGPETAGEAVRIAIGDQHVVVLPPPRTRAALERAGSRVLVGIRPEHVTLAVGGEGEGRAARTPIAGAMSGAAAKPQADATGAPPRVHAVVEHVEHLGHETLVRARVGDASLALRVEGMPAITSGTRVLLRLEERALHFFAGEGGQAL